MNVVQPIRSSERVKDISRYLKERSQRDYIMFNLGIYAGGLRISDILDLKVRDVKNREHINITEKKTKKRKKVIIGPPLRKALQEYLASNELKPDEYLIKSRQKDKEGKYKPITRSMAYKILNRAASEFGLDNIGTHTMRKTFGYHYYMQTHDIVTLQKIFGHSHPSITLRYIGIEQEQIDAALNDFDY